MREGPAVVAGPSLCYAVLVALGRARGLGLFGSG